MTAPAENVAGLVQRKERGLRYFPWIETDTGDTVHLSEASTGVALHVWLEVVPMFGGSVRLTLDQARLLRDELTWLIENHYQLTEETP